MMWISEAGFDFDMLADDRLYRTLCDAAAAAAGKAELLTGIEGISSGPVRRIVLQQR